MILSVSTMNLVRKYVSFIYTIYCFFLITDLLPVFSPIDGQLLRNNNIAKVKKKTCPFITRYGLKFYGFTERLSVVILYSDMYLR